MDNLLSSASLLLTILGIFFGLWYPEMEKLLDEKVPAYPEDRQKLIRRTRIALNAKSTPLVVVSALVALIYLPEVLRVLAASLRSLFTAGLASHLAHYDAVSTAFVMIGLLLVAVTGLSLWENLKLRRHLRKLNSPPRKVGQASVEAG